jgi:hypothetical protein
MITAEVSLSIRGEGGAAVDVSLVSCREGSSVGWWMSMVRSLIAPPGVENARLWKDQTSKEVESVACWVVGGGVVVLR